MPPVEMNLVAHRLFTALDSIPLTKYPPGVEPVPRDGRITRTCFFPAGCGVWNPTGTRGPLPDRPVMILGHNWGIPADFQQAVIDGIEYDESWPQRERRKCTTWYNLLPILQRAEVPLKDCFFTNFYMGLKANGRNTGEMPSSEAFIRICHAFLQEQLAIVQPSMVISLGQPATDSLSLAARGLECWRDPDGRPLGIKTVSLIDPQHAKFRASADANLTCIAYAMPHPCYPINFSKNMDEEVSRVTHGYAMSRSLIH